MNRNTLSIAICSLVIFGVIIRLAPHEPNMTAITAIAIISSIYIGRRYAMLLPIVILLLSDIVIGFYDWRLMLSVYGSFALIGVLSWINKKNRTIIPMGISLIGAPLLFFLITNTVVWFFSPWYEQSISGLLYAYELGLPFLRNMLLGDVIYTATLIGVCEMCIALARYVRHSRPRTHYLDTAKAYGHVNP